MSKSIIGKSVIVHVDSDSEDAVVGEQIIVSVAKQAITPDLKIDYLVYDMREIVSVFTKTRFLDSVKHWEWFYDPTKGKVIFKLYYEENK